MDKSIDKMLCQFAIDISKNRMTAWIYLRDPGDPRQLVKEEIMESLVESKITINKEVHSRLDTFMTVLASSEKVPERFVIAEGKAVREGSDGEFLWDKLLEEEGDAWQDDAPINYYTRNSIITIEKGQRIGTVIAPKPGVNGFDVFGKKLTPKKRPTEIQLANTVVMSSDQPGVVVANVAGKVIFEHGVLSMIEVLEITGDIDFESGNIDSVINVHVKGTVRDRFSIKSKKSVSVCGAIEAADVSAKDSILVRGGVLGREKGVLQAGGEIVAKFCDHADLRAYGDIKISKEVINSHVRTDGKLIAEHSVIVGSDVYAREGVVVGTLGSEANIPTTIIVGTHPDVIREAEQISQELKARKEHVDRIRKAIQPLIVEMKNLNPDQRERATELLFKADAIDADIAVEESRREALLKAGRAPEPPYVLVGRAIYPATVIRIGRKQVLFDKGQKGAVRIEKRKIENVTEIVVVNQLSGSITVLPSVNVEGPETTNKSDNVSGQTDQ